MGKGKKKTGTKRKWGSARSQNTPEPSADSETSAANGVTATVPSGPGKSNVSQIKRSGGGQVSSTAISGSSGVSSGGKLKGMQAPAHCLKSPAPPIMSSVASAVYAAMMEGGDRASYGLKGVTQNKKSANNSVASAAQDALSKNVSTKTLSGQKSPAATLAAAASAVAKGKKGGKGADSQVSTTNPSVAPGSKKGGRDAGSQTSPAPTPATTTGGKKGGKAVSAQTTPAPTPAAATGGKKGGKGVSAQVPTPTPAAAATGGKKGGKAVGSQTSPAPTPVPSGPTGVKKGGKGVGSETSPAPTPAAGPMAGKKKGAANSKKPVTSSAAGKTGDSAVKEEVKPKYGFRCFVCEKVFLFNAGSTHRESETLDVPAENPDSVILLTDSDGGVACRACSIHVKSTLANRANASQKNNKEQISNKEQNNNKEQGSNKEQNNNKDIKEEDGETGTNGKPSKNAKKRAAKKKKAEEAKETEAKAKERQRTIYLRCTPYTKAKDIQKKFQEVCRYLIDKEVHLHNLVTVDMEKGLYMGLVIDAEDKRLLLRAAPKLKQSKELSSIHIHRALSHRQEKELWESA